MKKKRFIDNEEMAIAYLESVLNEWDSWKTHHVLLVEAIELLLKSNESKRELIKVLRFQNEALNEVIKLGT